MKTYQEFITESAETEIEIYSQKWNMLALVRPSGTTVSFEDPDEVEHVFKSKETNTSKVKTAIAAVDKLRDVDDIIKKFKSLGYTHKEG